MKSADRATTRLIFLAAVSQTFKKPLFQLDRKDQVIDELEMRQSQIVLNHSEMANKPEVSIAVRSEIELSSEAKPEAATTLSKEEKEALESLRDQVRTKRTFTRSGRF